MCVSGMRKTETVMEDVVRGKRHSGVTRELHDVGVKCHACMHSADLQVNPESTDNWQHKATHWTNPLGKCHEGCVGHHLKGHWKAQVPQP